MNKEPLKLGEKRTGTQGMNGGEFMVFFFVSYIPDWALEKPEDWQYSQAETKTK